MNVVSDKGEVMELKFDQFYDVEKKISTAKFAEDKPLLKDVQVVQFQRNSTKMFWKQSYDDVEFKSALFLQKKGRESGRTPISTSCECKRNKHGEKTEYSRYA